MRRISSIILCSIVLTLFNESLSADLELFTLGWRGDYVRFDAHTGEVNCVLLGQPGRPGGIAESSEGKFYTITYGDTGGPKGLYEVDPLTGVHDYVCSTSNIYEIFGIAFSPSGVLYAHEDGFWNYIGTLDTKTGQFVKIGTITGDAEELFCLDFRPNTESLYGSKGDGIYSVNLTTLHTSLVVDSDTLNFSHILGFTFFTEDLVYVSGFYPTSQYPNYNYGIALYNIVEGRILDEVALPDFVYEETPLGHIALVPEIPSILEVAVDIKPRSCPNPINVKSSGILPVAILGSEDFDVNIIDVASIQLAGVEPIRSSYEDVAAPVSDGNDCNCITEGPDGFLDLTLKFKTQDIVATLGEVNHNDLLELQLDGVLHDETLIEGGDCVIIHGKHKPFNIADINKDGVVNAADFAIFTQNWLQSSIVDE
ncbi:MAG: hypothetical protein ACYS67_05290 [Planctomycetota bacterium]|jgi:hypothetical protein